jgi:hypothetical protein
MNKLILAVSAALNAILLMFLFGVVPFFLYLSILVNFVLVWYLVLILRDTKDLEQDFDIIFGEINSLVDHLEDVHGLEMFYGDQHLQDLIDHSKRVVNEIIDFQETHYNVDIEMEQIDDNQATEKAPEADEE